MRKLAGAAPLALAVLLAAPVLAQTQDELNTAAGSAENWLYATHDYSGQRFVPADLINSRNVDQLRPICMYQFGEVTTLQSNGLVYEGILYATTPTTTVALDATTCGQVWRHQWEARNDAGIASQRGMALSGGMLVRGTTDGYVIALDARTGAEIWAVDMRTPGSSESINMAPLIHGDLVVVGPAGTDRGWVAALDLTNGEEVWRLDTIPGEGDPALTTWSDPGALEAGEVGGGSVWTVMSLDVETDTLFVPVGNANPAFYGGDREGDNLYTNTVLAVDVRTGEMLWHYQVEPNGVHNWDTSQAGPVFSATIEGEERPLLATTGKNGLLHIIDRETREPLHIVPVTTIKNETVPLGLEPVHVCPGYLGGVQWNGPAFSPDTGLLYIPAVDWCSEFTSDPQAPRGGGFSFDPPESADGWISAVDPVSGTYRWRYRAGAPVIAAVTSTAGNLVFGGTLDGEFLALNASNGERLYSFATGGAMAGGILSYVRDGAQYVAAMTGNDSGLWGSTGSPTVVIFGLGQ